MKIRISNQLRLVRAFQKQKRIATKNNEIFTKMKETRMTHYKIDG